MSRNGRKLLLVLCNLISLIYLRNLTLLGTVIKVVTTPWSLFNDVTIRAVSENLAELYFQMLTKTAGFDNKNIPSQDADHLYGYYMAVNKTNKYLIMCIVHKNFLWCS